MQSLPLFFQNGRDAGSTLSGSQGRTGRLAANVSATDLPNLTKSGDFGGVRVPISCPSSQKGYFVVSQAVNRAGPYAETFRIFALDAVPREG